MNPKIMVFPSTESDETFITNNYAGSDSRESRKQNKRVNAEDMF